MEADRQNDIDSQVQPTRVGDVPDPTHMTPDDLHYLSELHDDLAETHTQCEKRDITGTAQRHSREVPEVSVEVNRDELRRLQDADESLQEP